MELEPANRCSICYEVIDHLAIVYPCAHKFGEDCIVEWARRAGHTPTCPLCRGMIQSIDCTKCPRLNGDEPISPTWQVVWVLKYPCNGRMDITLQNDRMGYYTLNVASYVKITYRALQPEKFDSKFEAVVEVVLLATRKSRNFEARLEEIPEDLTEEQRRKAVEEARTRSLAADENLDTRELAMGSGSYVFDARLNNFFCDSELDEILKINETCLHYIVCFFNMSAEQDSCECPDCQTFYLFDLGEVSPERIVPIVFFDMFQDRFAAFDRKLEERYRLVA